MLLYKLWKKTVNGEEHRKAATVHPDSQKTFQNLMTDQQFELVILCSSFEEQFTTLSAPQFLSTPDRTETNLESITGRYVLPHSSEQCFWGLSPCWALPNTGRSDRLQFTCQQHYSIVSRLQDPLPAPFSPPFHRVSVSWLHTTSKHKTTTNFVFIWFCGGLKSFGRECLKWGR